VPGRTPFRVPGGRPAHLRPRTVGSPLSMPPGGTRRRVAARGAPSGVHGEQQANFGACCMRGSHVFRMFIRMLQVFHADVAKVDLDVSMLQMLQK
jgi:hypothetical protein